MAQDDDEVWRSIVDNYGERPDLEDQPGPADDAAAPAAEPTPEDLPGPGRASFDPRWDRRDPEPDQEQEERFVPPPPPPVPTTTKDRTVAWFGIFGAPAILLVTLVLGIRLPEIVNYALVMLFVGGFLYLVVRMNREPRDPGDNGARL